MRSNVRSKLRNTRAEAAIPRRNSAVPNLGLGMYWLLPLNLSRLSVLSPVRALMKALTFWGRLSG